MNENNGESEFMTFFMARIWSIIVLKLIFVYNHIEVKDPDQFLFPTLREDNANAQHKDSRCNVMLRISD